MAAKREQASDRRPGLFVALHDVLRALLFGVAPVVLTVAVLGVTLVNGPFLYDFRGGLYNAGNRILHRDSPYQVAFFDRQAAIQRAGGSPQTVISAPVYTPFPLLAAVPFSILPYRLAGILFTLFSIAALVAAFRLLGVTDWRSYGVAVLSWPVLHGFMLGSVTPLLMLGAAFAWRYRHRTVAPAVALAAIVAIKLFPIMLGGWLIATRRYTTAALAAIFTLVAIFGSWAIIGFSDLSRYPRMLSDLAQVSQGVSVSLVAGLLNIGISSQSARIVALAVSGALLLIAWRLARRPDGDRAAFSLAVIACLTVSPMVWPHYLALLFIPIALASPRLSWLWFVPLALYAAPFAQTTGRPWAIIPYLATLALVASFTARTGPTENEAGPRAHTVRARPVPAT